MNTLIALMGFPRSGKTTISRTFGFPVVNPDSIRLALHGERFIARTEPFVWAIATVMVRALFLAGHSTICLDATNTTRKRRDAWQSTDWTTLFKVIDTPADICIMRAKATGDMDIIPVIERMAKEFEPLSADETLFIG